MKKLLSLVLSVLLTTTVAVAAGGVSDISMKAAIKKYKTGNYTGCLQDMQSFVKIDPSNAMAHYYIAMSYVQSGKRDEALEAYDKVIALKPNNILYNYANRGKVCLETPDQCYTKVSNESDLDKFIAAPYGDGLSDQIKSEMELKRIQEMKKKINNDSEIDPTEFEKFRNFDKKKTQLNKDAVPENPTDEEVLYAIKVLRAANIPLNTAQPNSTNDAMAAYNQYAAMLQNQNSQYNDLSMFLGNNNQNNNNNNMMNMLPFILAQSGKDGNNKIPPHLIQSMMMNSLMPDFNFNTSDN